MSTRADIEADVPPIVRALVEDLVPVRRLPAPERRAWQWTALALGLIGAGTAVLGLRPDLARVLGEPAFGLANATLIAVVVVAARWALQLGVPGTAPGARPALAMVAATAVWLIAIARHGPAGDGELAWAAGVPCAARIAGLAIAPAAALFAMLRRASVRAAGSAGWLAAVSAVALAVTAMQLVCAKDSFGHALRWHAGPAVVLAAAGFAAGRAVLRARG